MLPGVGAFDAGVAALDRLDLRQPILDRVAAGTPLLGICLGMQLLFERSEEGSARGLACLRGRCVRFSGGAFKGRDALKVPHMGWNEVRPRDQTTLFRGMATDAAFYFVHSFHCACDRDEDVLARATYGTDFVAAVQRGNVYGTQFHPEKSHKHGMRLLQSFARL